MSKRKSGVEELREIAPPVLMALGAISLLRTSRLLSLALAGVFLYDLAGRSDKSRRASAKEAVSETIDRELEDSFPASDPPSFSGSTAGAP